MKKLILILLLLISENNYAQTIRVGAKHFNEGYILAEIISQLIESKGYNVERKFNLGGTLVCYKALVNGEIDVYPEYTGTISEAILKLEQQVTYGELKANLNEKNLEISGQYGFNNTYAFAVRKETADKLGLKNISDLKNQTGIKIGLSYEFLNREDGWKNLAGVYDLTQTPAGLEHGLAYKALEEGQIDLTDVYSTDGEIPKYNLKILNDDKNFFPKYYAVSFYKKTLPPEIKQLLEGLTGKITDDEMQKLNAEVLYENKSFAQTASGLLKKESLISDDGKNDEGTNMISEIIPKVIQHLKITFISLLIAIIIAVPLGIFIYFHASVSRPVLYIAGLLQTIPSIALLAFMIPLFGIGVLPAVIALFLYGLLPILRNTTVSLFSVDPVIKEVASGIGLTKMQKLKHVELPLALPTIIAGIRIAAVINIGTATLAAFIGAGGLGEFIVTGLALNNIKLILMGAIPAAILAILTEIAFEAIEKYFTPKQLRH